MQFNPSSGLGICQETRSFLGFAINDTTSYPLVDLVRNANSWYRRVNSWIWNVTGKWEYDDENFATLPIATTDLVNNQQDYSLPSTSQKVFRVEIKDINGDWYELFPIDQTDIKGQAMSEFYETAGRPIYYDLIGNSLLLYPKPDTAQVTATAGLNVYFSREIQEFTILSTSTEPGFNADFHRLISMGSALDRALANGMNDKVTYLRQEITNMKDDLSHYYGSRDVVKRANMRASSEGVIGYI
jgi:hypothetical protein